MPTTIVEDAPSTSCSTPQHPYARSLLAALPNPADDTRPPGQIPAVLLPTDFVEGLFRPRCDHAQEACGSNRPCSRGWQAAWRAGSCHEWRG